MTAENRIDDHVKAANVKGVTRFAKVYDKGWDTIANMAGNAMAIKIYSFIAKHCDHLNALVCPIEVMAEEFGVNERTIRRAVKFLEDQGHVVVVKVGTANAYVLDASDLWKNYDQYKNFCAFNAKTLASKAQNKMLKKRLTHFMGQPELFDTETGEVRARQ